MINTTTTINTRETTFITHLTTTLTMIVMTMVLPATKAFGRHWMRFLDILKNCTVSLPIVRQRKSTPTQMTVKTKTRKKIRELYPQAINLGGPSSLEAEAVPTMHWWFRRPWKNGFSLAVMERAPSPIVMELIVQVNALKVSTLSERHVEIPSMIGSRFRPLKKTTWCRGSLIWHVTTKTIVTPATSLDKLLVMNNFTRACCKLAQALAVKAWPCRAMLHWLRPTCTSSARWFPYCCILRYIIKIMMLTSWRKTCKACSSQMTVATFSGFFSTGTKGASQWIVFRFSCLNQQHIFHFPFYVWDIPIFTILRP